MFVLTSPFGEEIFRETLTAYRECVSFADDISIVGEGAKTIRFRKVQARRWTLTRADRSISIDERTVKPWRFDWGRTNLPFIDGGFAPFASSERRLPWDSMVTWPNGLPPDDWQGARAPLGADGESAIFHRVPVGEMVADTLDGQAVYRIVRTAIVGQQTAGGGWPVYRELWLDPKSGLILKSTRKAGRGSPRVETATLHPVPHAQLAPGELTFAPPQAGS